MQEGLAVAQLAPCLLFIEVTLKIPRPSLSLLHLSYIVLAHKLARIRTTMPSYVLPSL
jgi:hypothetical protein